VIERKLSSTRMRHTILNPALYHPKAATAPIGFRIPRLILCSQSKYNLSELWHDSLCRILLFHQTTNEYYISHPPLVPYTFLYLTFQKALDHSVPPDFFLYNHLSVLVLCYMDEQRRKYGSETKHRHFNLRGDDQK
jgi:hypothetical protein